jgi:CRP/FNR family cyclic AMP-dependent transcriptional regulator
MTPRAAARKRRDFDPHVFLATIGEGRKIARFQKKQTIFAQGDSADSVFYVQTGKVKLTVVSNTGKEATIGILDDGYFLVKLAWWASRFACSLQRQ